jgi:peptidoglycan/xylan/chitin deacetylase (PgdA/CDA1 family)
MKILPNIIINFHAIYESEWMDNVFNLLKRFYHCVPIIEIEKYFYNGKILRNTCHITFDDGDMSFYNIVYPLLKKHNIPVSIYVSPFIARERKNYWFQEMRGYDKKELLDVAKLNNKIKNSIKDVQSIHAILKSLSIYDIWKVLDRYREITGTVLKESINMDVNQLRELHNSELVDVGAHTQNHPILKNEKYEDAYYEISSSIDELSDILGDEIRYFAYPNGIPNLDFSNREVEILKEKGIKLAFTTENKIIKCSDNPLTIPRKGISKGNSSFIIIKLIAGKRWDLLKRITKGKQSIDYRKMLI